jgi:cytidine deaminase
MVKIPDKIKKSDWDELVRHALEVRKNAYCPYSGFSVGAAVLCSNGRIFAGCNVENSSYGLSVCAERVALLKAVSEGERRILAMAVASDIDPPVAPCGACRQMLSEFNPRLPIVLVTPGGLRKKTDLERLFPRPFKHKTGSAAS